jgi:hypothetical protein
MGISGLQSARRGGGTEPAESGLRLRVHRHIAEIDPAEWDALVPAEEIQMSHRFIRLCQDSRVENAEYRHVVVEDATGACAVASCSAMRVRLDLLAPRPVRAPMRGLRRFLPSFMIVPVLFCGLPVSFGRPCLRFRQAPPLSTGHRSRVLRLLSGLMHDLARELGVSLICFKEFAPEESAEVSELAELGYRRAPSLPSYRLPIRWPSFPAYLAAMRAGYRRQLRQARAGAGAAGLSFRSVEDFSAECPAIFELYRQVMERVEFQLERLNLDFFERLNRDLAGESRAILAERDGRLVCAAILLQRGAQAAFLLAGVDDARSRETGAYVNLVAEVVADAIRRGAKVLEMGQTSAALKTRFGAHETSRDLYLRGTTPGIDRVLRLAGPLLFPSRHAPVRRVFRDS